MKKHYLISLILFGIFQQLSAQVAPQVSSIENPIWYYIESAKNDAVNTLGTTSFEDFSNYVIYSPTTDGKVKYRIISHNDDEMWAIVNISGIIKLYNKATGKYLTASHSLNSTGEEFKWINYTGTDQYKISSGTTNPMIAWNNLICDRYTDQGANSQTAWYFKLVTALSPKDELKIAIDAAISRRDALTGENPGYISSTSEAFTTLNNAIATAQAIYDSTKTDEEYNNAKTVINTAIETFETSAKNPIILSTEGNETWYYIINGSNVDYCANKGMINRSSTPGTRIQFADKKADPNMLWKIVDAGNGKYAIQNRASDLYISTIITTGTQTEIGAYTIEDLDSEGRFKIYANSGDLHPEASSSNIVNWNEDGTYRSTWRFQTISDEEAETPVSVSQITVKQGHLTTAIGNQNFALLYFTTEVSGFTGEATLESIKLKLDGTTNIEEIENLRIYKTPTMKFKPEDAELLGTGTISSADITVTLDNPLNLTSGNNLFCVVVDISENAKEGNLVDASVLSVQLTGLPEKAATNPSPENSATIFLTQAVLFSPGDYNSVSYRIPSIVTAKDGSLITSTDKRKFHSGDLSADIDQYIRRSTDNGKTWSDVLLTCGENTSLGYGDPALVVDQVTGKIICLVVHDKSFFGSSSSAPIKVISLESNDNGISWSEPKDITNQLYGANCENTATKNWAGMFISSGRGLQLRNGRILFAGVVRDGVNSGLQVHAVYTDDLGETWHVSPYSAINGGDESKFAEKNNGDVIVSIRKAPKRYWNTSTDNGITWGNAKQQSYLTDPACNGEILAYTSTLDGYEKNRILHSLCYASNRTNVSMLLSYDEGETYPIRKTICAASSAYSTFTILNDGTIGMYYEDGSTGNTYDMIFVRFSLDWLTNGLDKLNNPSLGTKNIKKKIEARIENNRVLITGSNSEFKIFNTMGMEISQNTNLISGTYIVKVENETIKVIAQ